MGHPQSDSTYMANNAFESVSDAQIATAPRTVPTPSTDFDDARSIFRSLRNDYSAVDVALLGFPAFDLDDGAERVKMQGQDTRAFAGKVSEKISDADRKALKRDEIQTSEATEIRKEINQKGQDPKRVLLDALKDNSVLLIGETHQENNPHRKLATSMMADFKAAGATHLALEIPKKSQPILDEYMRTGDEKVLDKLVMESLFGGGSFHGQQSYRDLIEAAHKAGLKLVAVDTTVSAFDFTRDKSIAQNVGDILKSDEKAKVIMWYGSRHGAKDGPGELKSVLGEVIDRWEDTAAELLRKGGHSVATVWAGAPSLDQDERLLSAAGKVKDPVAIKTKDAPHLAELKSQTVQEFWERYQKYGDWDYVILYP